MHAIVHEHETNVHKTAINRLHDVQFYFLTTYITNVIYMQQCDM